MPGTRYTVFNPQGESYVPETEQFAFKQKAQQMSDWLASQQLQAQLSMHRDTLADRGTQRVHEGNLMRDIQGTFGQRHGGDIEKMTRQGEITGGHLNTQIAGNLVQQELVNKGGADMARIGNEPAMGALGFERDKWNDPSVKGVREQTLRRNTYDNNRFGREDELDELIHGQLAGALRAGSAGGGQGLIGGRDLTAIMRKRAGLGEDPADAMFNKYMMERMSGADPSEVPGLAAAMETRDWTKIPGGSARLDQKTVNEMQQVQPLVTREMESVRKFIRDNNWSLGETNQNELASLYQSFLGKLQSLRVSPSTLSLLEGELKQTMRDALQENGVFFGAAGTSDVKKTYGLE
jgi:hypothetical protein